MDNGKERLDTRGLHDYQLRVGQFKSKAPNSPFSQFLFIPSLHISFTGELPYPQLSLTRTSPLHLTLGTHGMNTPNTCSVVLVAGSALYNLQAVMDTVDSLVKDMLKVPYVMILLVENPDMILSTIRHALSPAVVSVYCVSYSRD